MMYAFLDRGMRGGDNDDRSTTEEDKAITNKP